MAANNVVDFTSRLVNKQLDDYYDAEQEEFDEYTETLNYLYDDLLESLQECGMANDEDEFIKDFAYSMESIRALVDRQFGNNHGFHKLIDEKMSVERDEDGIPTDVVWLPDLTGKE